MLTCDSRSRVDPNRLFVFRAPEATPRTRPIDRDKKLTNRSASPSGYVCKIIASDSCTGICLCVYPVIQRSALRDEGSLLDSPAPRRQHHVPLKRKFLTHHP